MLRAIGLMSGTSLDGVDAALIETDGHVVRRSGKSVTLAYDADLRADLRALLDRAPDLAGADPFAAHVAARVTQRHIEAVAALAQPADIVGFHGQTILHKPGARRTWQIGDAAALARAVDVPVAYDFRSADVEAGGEGAPLAPIYHACLSAGIERPLAVLNIGGVANVTWIGPQAPESGDLGADGSLIACDTGPGNGPLDDWILRHTGEAFDRDGGLAARGSPDEAVLAQLLDNPYFARTAPKSLDRLDFATSLAGSGLDDLAPADGAATLIAFTAEAVRRTKLPSAPLCWLVTGGGRHNNALMHALRERLSAPVEKVEVAGWDGDALEAECFGLLAVRVRLGLPLSFPGTTGVPHPMPGGRIAMP